MHTQLKMNTFSIVARCPETGHLGAAGATKFPAIGAHSPHIKSDCGVVATQGWVNPVLGPEGIRLLESGFTANETLQHLLMQDPGRELRQVAIVDRFGNAAAYTGIENDDHKGHIIRDGCCVQGNLLSSPDTLEQMMTAFQSKKGKLEERLLVALEAADKCGGDKRGKQSTVLRVDIVEGFPYINYRVDDHPEPIQELRRIFDENKDGLVSRYYEWIDSVKQGTKLV